MLYGFSVVRELRSKLLAMILESFSRMLRNRSSDPVRKRWLLHFCNPASFARKRTLAGIRQGFNTIIPSVFLQTYREASPSQSTQRSLYLLAFLSFLIRTEIIDWSTIGFQGMWIGLINHKILHGYMVL